ncbi:hypothetical protein BDK92_1233 [Micromonospora pisi]|uniref:SCO6045-like C-terminal domain-containing protein n=1 Tax=Micromonospora pisi TaxID=589240 RepID=A0A495JE01_9ACTN|nr:hypothetical protein [Micromonospora pisi]RKR86961.1 hypothetical protein BDK92_1233 [Micromonospora pisi]
MTTPERSAADRTTAGPSARDRLAARQAELVATLVSGAAVPAGFDTRLVGAARAALLNKRAGDVARHWPLLAAGLGAGWSSTFGSWAATRPTNGSLRDGWDLARELAAGGRLPAPAAEELAVREAAWRYDGGSAPDRRRAPGLGRVGRVLALQVAGRVRLLRGGAG